MNSVKFVLACFALGTSVFGHVAMAEDLPSWTTGPAETIDPSLYECQGARARVTAVGRITSDDGKAWIVPAETHFESADKAADLFNQCSGVEHRSLADLDLGTIPLMDAGGVEVFTAYVFADNYFELYVNGRLLAVDAVPFTPFNSSVIRFKANRPLSVAVMGIDWEENLGLGSESNRGVAFHPGDAGLIAVIKDGSGKTVATTNSTWRAQTFYTAPLDDRSCLSVKGSTRDSSACSTASVRDGSVYSAAHWPVPKDWFTPDFDDSGWPLATEFTNDTVGVDNKPAFMNFQDLFDDPKADAEFIWSSNLVLDNLVLLRTTIE